MLEISINVKKYHILQVGTRNQIFDYEINGVKLESVQYVKDLGTFIAQNLKFSQQCKDVAGKANRMLVFINRNFSTPVLSDPSWNAPCNFGLPTIQKDIAKLETVQQRVTKVISPYVINLAQRY